MTNFAIVIGIDGYANPEWVLGAAVPDALRFVEWVTGPGGVANDPAHLRLLLSPAQPEATVPPHQPATSENINRAILDFRDGAGNGGERLYFYYAGHGVSSPDASRGGPPEPCIIPADVREMRVNANLLLRFTDIIPYLSRVEPKEQFFFIDACRDFLLENYLPPISSSMIRWNPPISDPSGPQSAQYVLYATSLGQRAAESVRGQGAFGGVLLEGLKGSGTAKIWVQPPPRYEVRFRTLVPFVRKRVEAVIKRLAQANAAQYIQIPEREALGGSEETDPLLASLKIDEVDAIPITVRLTPKEARTRGRVRFVNYLPGGEEYVRAEMPAPGAAPPEPLPVAATFSLPPGEYTVVATADGFQERRETCLAYEAITLDFKLNPEATMDEEAVQTRSIDLPLGAEQPRRADEMAPGRLEVTSADRSLVIVVRDSQRQVVTGGMGTGSLSLPSLAPGIYTVQPVLPGGEIEDQTVEVRAGETTSLALSLAAPALQVGSNQASMLTALGIISNEGKFLDSAAHLGPLADTKLASLLGFAAFAAYWQGEGFDRLRTLGVTPLQNIPEGEGGLLVLIGAAGDEPAPGVTPAQFLAAGHLVVRTLTGEALDEGGFTPLSGFSAAAQRQTRVPVGQVKVELRLPNLAPTHYALTALPNRVTVMVVAAEQEGGFEIQQYLVPLGGTGTAIQEFLMADPGNIRRLELAQRYYAAGHNTLADIVSEADLDALLYGKWLDPLLGCIAGYTLLRRGMAQRYIGQPVAHPDPQQPEMSAMRNMLKFFPELPDSHVLAGLAEPERRAEHYANALRWGLPVFADGFRALYAWHQEQPEQMPTLLVDAGSGLVPTSVWTTWTIVRPVLLLQECQFDDAPPGWEILGRAREGITRSCRGVGRIEISGAATSLATGFVVAADLVLTPRFVATAFATQDASGRWNVTPGARALIDFSDDPGADVGQEHEVIEVVGVEGFAGGDEVAQIALLRVTPTSRNGTPLPGALTLAAQAPDPAEGRTVYVIGYPAGVGMQISPTLMGLAFANKFNVKRLQPGKLLDVTPDDRQFHHDCFTLGGNAGSCVVDAETNLVLGLHLGGNAYVKGHVKYNFATALWMFRESPLLRDTGVQFA